MFQDTSPIYQFRGPLGIPVQIGSSLGMLVLFYVFMSGGNLISTLGIVAMLVASIFLHEMGHAWASEIQGVPVRRIMLYGGGGFCESKRSANAWQQEFIVAMGPIVNLTLWAFASLGEYYLWMWVISDPSELATPGAITGDLRVILAVQLGLFAMINGFLAVFNLIPVQPLDGGKLLHLAMLRVMAPMSAMKVAGSIGLILSILWIPAMLVAYVSGWWILFFVPSIPTHFAMARGRLG